MFEFEDEKLGRVKVVNVTEARSSMASMMGDKDSNYIVTKNNKPIRIVVSYETFKKALSTHNPTSVRAGNNKTPEFKDSLKGLIQSKEKELKEQFIATTPKSSPIIPRDKVSEEIPTASASAILPPPDSDRTESEPLLPEPSPTEPTLSELTTPYVTTNTPPPNNDYFNRFKKLYEAPRHEFLFQKSVSTSTEVSRPSSKVDSVEASSTPTPNRRPNSREGASSHLPSIQDLLSELEQEKLTGEEENPLSSNQVNQLLNRITK